MCSFGLSGCRVKPQSLLQKCQEQLQLICPPLEKVNDQLLQIFQKKVSNTTVPPLGPTPLGLHFFLGCCLCCLLVAFLVACVPVAACCCRCFCCCLCLFAASGPPTFAVFDLSKMLLTFFTIDWSPLNLNQLRQNLPVSHRISTGRRSSSPPPPHTSWALIFLGLALLHSGLPCSCCCVKNTPLPLLTFQNVCTACCFFVLFLSLLLLLDAGFSSCVLFFLLFVLLLLPLLRFAVVYGVAFVAAASCSFTAAFAAFAAFAALLLLLLRVLSGRRPLKSQSLPAFDLPKCQKEF